MYLDIVELEKKGRSLLLQITVIDCIQGLITGYFMAILGVSFSIVGIGTTIQPDLYVPFQDFWILVMVIGAIQSIIFTYMFSRNSLGSEK